MQYFLVKCWSVVLKTLDLEKLTLLREMCMHVYKCVYVGEGGLCVYVYVCIYKCDFYFHVP